MGGRLAKRKRTSTSRVILMVPQRKGGREGRRRVCLSLAQHHFYHQRCEAEEGAQEEASGEAEGEEGNW